jgi:hypothetical protein
MHPSLCTYIQDINALLTNPQPIHSRYLLVQEENSNIFLFPNFPFVSILLIHLNRINQPIRLIKRMRVLSYVGFAGRDAGFGGTVCPGGPGARGGAGFFATEGCVEILVGMLVFVGLGGGSWKVGLERWEFGKRERDDMTKRTVSTHNSLRRETRIDVTIPILAIKIRQRQSPARRIRVSSRNISGYTTSGPEIDLDKSAGPLHSVDAASCCVERVAVATYGTFNTAAGGGESAVEVITVGGAFLGAGGWVEGA